MEDVFPESLGQKCGCVVYTGVHYTQQNMVYLLKRIKIYLLKLFSRTKNFFSQGKCFIYLFTMYLFMLFLLILLQLVYYLTSSLWLNI